MIGSEEPRLARVLARLPDAKPCGSAWRATCPAHDDGTPSLDVEIRSSGWIRLHCWAGCEEERIRDVLGLTRDDVSPKESSWRVLRGQQASKPMIDWSSLAKSHAAKITDDQVQTLAELLHVDPKALRDLGVGWDGGQYTFPMYGADGGICGIRTRHPKTGEKKAIKGSKLGVFRRLAPDDGFVVICEGESDTAAALTMGLDAIGLPGAGNCAEAAAAFCRGRDVALIADDDPAGQRGMAKVQGPIAAAAESVRIVTPPAKDLREWLCRGATSVDVQDLIDSMPPLRTRRGTTPAQVLDQWLTEGPLEHLPTGIAALDEQTGGGPTYNARIVMMGGPDAGKTAFLLQLLDTYADRGFTVGLLAVDEEADDVTTRLLQRRGWGRKTCEARDAGQVATMREQVADLPIVIYGPEWTIEEAGDDLARRAKARGVPAVLGVDSLQTATAAAEADAVSRYETVSLRVQALRAVSTRHRMLTIATSEMSRAAYRDASNRIDDMAAAKESGAIEYSSRLLLSLRSVAGESDLVELRVVKNKLGPRTREDEQGVLLRLDRSTQTLSEEAASKEDVCDRREMQAAQRSRYVLEDAARIAVALAKHPGCSERKLFDFTVAAMKEEGMGRPRFNVALATLDEAVVDGGRRGKGGGKGLYLQGDLLRSDVLELVPLPDRPNVLAAHAPEANEVTVSVSNCAPTASETQLEPSNATVSNCVQTVTGTVRSTDPKCVSSAPYRGARDTLSAGDQTRNCVSPATDTVREGSAPEGYDWLMAFAPEAAEAMPGDVA